LSSGVRQSHNSLTQAYEPSAPFAHAMSKTNSPNHVSSTITEKSLDNQFSMQEMNLDEGWSNWDMFLENLGDTWEYADLNALPTQ
jgi:hypothetical protein